MPRSPTAPHTTTLAESAGRDRRLSLSSVSSARSLSLNNLSNPSGRVRVTILKSPKEESASLSNLSRSASGASLALSLNSPASPFATPSLPYISPGLFSPSLASTLGSYGLLELGDTSPALREAEPLPPLPNKRFSEAQVFSQLGLSVAAVSPQPSPFVLDDTPLPPVSAAGGIDVPQALSPRRRPISYQAPHLSPTQSMTSSVLAAREDLHPVVEEIDDTILLPFRDRPAEVADLMHLRRNKWVFDQIQKALACEADHVLTHTTSPCDAWTWTDFEAHLLTPRSLVTDLEWVRRAQRCLTLRAEVLWERFRNIIGIDVQDLFAGVAEGCSDMPLVDLDTVCEGDALLESRRAAQELQRHRSTMMPESSSPPFRGRRRTRSSGSSMSASRSMLGMSPIDEDEIELPSLGQLAIGATASSSRGAPLGLRLTASSSQNDLQRRPRSRSHSRALSNTSADIHQRAEDAFSTFSDDFAVLTDDEDDSSPLQTSALSPRSSYSAGYGALTGGPALPDLQTMLAA